MHGVTFPSISSHCSVLAMSAVRSPLHVLVTGYGRVGDHILTALTDPEYSSPARTPQVKTFLLVRPASLAEPSKRAAIDQYAAKGVTVVEGDLAQGAAAITQLLQRHAIHTVVSVVGRSPQLEYQYGLIEAAKAAGVQHFIPSDFGTDYDAVPQSSVIYEAFAKPKVSVHEAVKRSGLDWTFIANGWFAEIVYGLTAMGVDVSTRTVSAPVSVDTTTTITALTDVGRLTAAAVVDPSTRNQQLFFGRQYTYEQIAAALEKATGDRVTRKVRSKEELLSNPTDMSNRFALSLLQSGNSFPEAQTYKHGQYTYTTLEAVVSQLLSQPVRSH